MISIYVTMFQFSEDFVPAQGTLKFEVKFFMMQIPINLVCIILIRRKLTIPQWVPLQEERRGVWCHFITTCTSSEIVSCPPEWQMWPSLH